MKSKAATFFTGALTGALVVAVALLLPRHVSLRRSSIPEWNRQDVVQKGFADFRKGSPVLERWDVGRVAEECLSDFQSMAVGHARLGLVYGVGDGRYLVLMFDADHDEWGRDVTDRVIAYVYDTRAKTLVGKFWAPMA